MAITLFVLVWVVIMGIMWASQPPTVDDLAPTLFMIPIALILIAISGFIFKNHGGKGNSSQELMAGKVSEDE